MKRPLFRSLIARTVFPWPEQDRRWIQELPEQLGARRFRLLLSAWCRDLTEPWLDKAFRRDRQLRNTLQETYRAALEVSDRFADTGKSKTALKEARTSIFFRAIEETFGVASILDNLLSEDSLVETLDRCAMLVTQRDRLPIGELVPLLRRYVSDLTAPEEVERTEPGFQDPKVLTLAKLIYQERQFQRMPELARALKRAGSRNSVALAHCDAVDPAHHRGCWVLDLILCKD